MNDKELQDEINGIKKALVLLGEILLQIGVFLAPVMEAMRILQETIDVEEFEDV